MYERQRVQEGRRGGGEEEGQKGRYRMLLMFEKYWYN